MAQDCAPFGVYGFSNVSFSIDGRRVIGFAEGDDVIMIEPTTELGKPVIGADGSSIVSVTADQSATITIKLLMTSPFNQWLLNRANRLRQSPNRDAGFSVGFTDMSNGDNGGCTSAVIIQLPNETRGANAVEKEWKIFCPCWQPGQIEIGA